MRDNKKKNHPKKKKKKKTNAADVVGEEGVASAAGCGKNGVAEEKQAGIAGKGSTASLENPFSLEDKSSGRKFPMERTCGGLDRREGKRPFWTKGKEGLLERSLQGVEGLQWEKKQKKGLCGEGWGPQAGARRRGN